jgi:DNA-binding transcriptional MerR regulator
MKSDNQTNFANSANEPAKNEQTFSISELAKEFDITTRSIRFYEDQGLISPERNGQTRIYSKRDKVRLKLILRGKRLGFTLAETGRLFELYDADKSSAKQLVTMLDLISEKKADLSQQMDDIKVVPNPYVMTNMMEEAVSNPFLNQRRKLMFTHIPAECTIHIFTVSGVLVDKLEVDNEPENGIVHWDMLTREGLEIAAGMYLYHIESNVSGDAKIGKFAVIK